MDYASLRASIDRAAEAVEQVAGTVLDFSEKVIDTLEDFKEHLPEQSETATEGSPYPFDHVEDEPGPVDNAPVEASLGEKVDYIYNRVETLLGYEHEWQKQGFKNALLKQPEIVNISYDTYKKQEKEDTSANEDKVTGQGAEWV